MAIEQVISTPITWKSFEDETINDFVGLDGEPFIDRRNGGLKICISDGLTPGGIRTLASGMAGYIFQPTILTPIAGVQDIVLSPNITSSPFIGLSVDGAVDSHKNTYWEINKLPGFSGSLFSAMTTGNGVEVWDLSLTVDILPPSTQLYVRCRYESDSGVLSEWSPISMFVTAAV